MVTGVPGVGLPWSERSTLSFESWTKILEERIHRRGIEFVITFANSPVCTTVLLIRANVPSARVAGLDGYDLGSIFQGTFDVEVLLVVGVLKRPTVTGVLSPPLHGGVRIRP